MNPNGESMSVSSVLRRVIWRRRSAFYDEAQRRGIVTAEQVEALHMLHAERDEAQDQREGEW